MTRWLNSKKAWYISSIDPVVLCGTTFEFSRFSVSTLVPFKSWKQWVYKELFDKSIWRTLCKPVRSSTRVQLSGFNKRGCNVWSTMSVLSHTLICKGWEGFVHALWAPYLWRCAKKVSILRSLSGSTRSIWTKALCTRSSSIGAQPKGSVAIVSKGLTTVEAAKGAAAPTDGTSRGCKGGSIACIAADEKWSLKLGCLVRTYVACWFHRLQTRRHALKSFTSRHYMIRRRMSGCRNRLSRIFSQSLVSTGSLRRTGGDGFSRHTSAFKGAGSESVKGVYLPAPCQLVCLNAVFWVCAGHLLLHFLLQCLWAQRPKAPAPTNNIPKKAWTKDA